MPDMRIFHIATLADWKEAQASGSYAVSTLGRTLEQEGYIHAARHDQVPAVRDRYYADVTEPLVVLEVDTDLLDAEVRDEQVGDEVFPHVYGPIPADAVVAWRPARLPPIDLGGLRRASAPLPPMTKVFRGVGVVLAAAAVSLFAAASVAQGGVDDGRLSDDLGFLLWTLTITVGVAALASFGYAEWARRGSDHES
jgi:glutathione S-transferase